jgi:hypothetical protein
VAGFENRSGLLSLGRLFWGCENHYAADVSQLGLVISPDAILDYHVAVLKLLEADGARILLRHVGLLTDL